MSDIEITFTNISNLDKEIRMSILREMRGTCGLSLNDFTETKDKISKGLPISMRYLSEGLLDFLQENKIEIKISYDNKYISIDEYWEKIEEENGYEDDEEDDKGTFNDFLAIFIRLFIEHIRENINNDNLLSENKNDRVKGKLDAYYKLLTFLK